MLLGEADAARRRARRRGRLPRGVATRSPRDGPLCLAVDDVQWLDAASLAALRFALARARPRAGRRAARPSAASRRRGCGEACPRRGSQIVEIDGLSVGATPRAAPRAPRRDASRGRRWSGSGRHLRRQSLLRARARERPPPPRRARSAPGDPLPIPVDARRRSCASASTASGRRRSRSRAWSRPSPSRPLTSWRRRSGRASRPALAEALDARILELDGERLRFTHPLLGSAVAAVRRPHADASLHARLAEVVSERARSERVISRSRRPSSDAEIAAILEDGGAVRAGSRRAGDSRRAGRASAQADAAGRRRRCTPTAASSQPTRHHVVGRLRAAIALLDGRASGFAPGRRARRDSRAARLRASQIHAKPRRSTIEALAEADGDDALEATIAPPARRPHAIG